MWLGPAATASSSECCQTLNANLGRPEMRSRLQLGKPTALTASMAAYTSSREWLRPQVCNNSCEMGKHGQKGVLLCHTLSDVRPPTDACLMCNCQLTPGRTACQCSRHTPVHCPAFPAAPFCAHPIEALHPNRGLCMPMHSLKAANWASAHCSALPT
jgi:hypothetical protein